MTPNEFDAFEEARRERWHHGAGKHGDGPYSIGTKIVPDSNKHSLHHRPTRETRQTTYEAYNHSSNGYGTSGESRRASNNWIWIIIAIVIVFALASG